ncbi:MAG: VCBS repeat-containing protein, partial [Planctomycetes bacterium]|nr:VCBS repeat-containing protein [Planctomycetota bacterium]
MAVADFNGDGYVDVAYGNLGQPAMNTYNRVTVCWNNGSGAFTTTSVAACSS